VAKGSLNVVGTGYQIVSQTTPEALSCIQRADKFFFLADIVTERWLQQLHPNGQSLGDTYAVGKNRWDTYEEMVERLLEPVRNGLNVCAAFYGHPGVCAYAPHEAVRRAVKEGYQARMFPGISSTDCLFADLGIDPSEGCQLFEASDFLILKRKLDCNVSLILWQICSIGVETYYPGSEVWNPDGVRILMSVLQKTYGSRHKVILYQASTYPVCDALIEEVSLGRLHEAKISSASLLYVPAKRKPVYDRQMLARLRKSARALSK
jgi:precorrin-3B methylase